MTACIPRHSVEDPTRVDSTNRSFKVSTLGVSPGAFHYLVIDARSLFPKSLRPDTKISSAFTIVQSTKYLEAQEYLHTDSDVE